MNNEEEKDKKVVVASIDMKIIITALVIGFIGGLLASLLIFGLNHFPEDVLARGHPLISAPFLAFWGILILVFLFYTPLQTRLSKSQFTIKWGDKEISIAEIEKNLDEQFAQFEAKLSDLGSEIQNLKSQLSSSGKELEVAASADENNNSTKLKHIKDSFDWVTSDDMAKIVFYLGTSKYTWRNQSTLVQRTDLPLSYIDELIQSVPEEIIRSKGKSGNIIYRLSDSARGKFLQLSGSDIFASV